MVCQGFFEILQVIFLFIFFKMAIMNKNETIKKEEKIKELMSMSVAAERLDICYRTLQSLVYKRKIGFVKVGRHYKFRKDDLDKFIEKNYIKPV